MSYTVKCVPIWNVQIYTLFPIMQEKMFWRWDEEGDSMRVDTVEVPTLSLLDVVDALHAGRD